MSNCLVKAASGFAAMCMLEHWYAASCKPRQEAVAEGNHLRVVAKARKSTRSKLWGL
ncbi:MAG: hypothetical protein OEV15_01000 [Gallionella sp.]|nr:hypothetical protein [Gallionella sp.]